METQTKCYLLSREKRSSNAMSSYSHIYNHIPQSPWTFELVWLIFKWLPAVLFYISQPNPAVHFLPRPKPFQTPHLLLPAQSWLPWSVGRGVALIPPFHPSPLASQLYFSNGSSVSWWVAPSFAFAHTSNGFTIPTPPFIPGCRRCAEQFLNFLQVFDRFFKSIWKVFNSFSL